LRVAFGNKTRLGYQGEKKTFGGYFEYHLELLRDAVQRETNKEIRAVYL